MSNGSSNQFARFVPMRPTNISVGAFSGPEILISAVAGMVAACAIAFLPMPLRIPGHMILKAGLPIACGVALVARPLSGTVASTSGLLTSAIFLLAGVGHLSPAAMVSLISFGPAVDLALRNANGKWNMLVRLALGGMGANLLAFGVRWGSALFQNDLLHSLSFRQFISTALISFVLCGLAAGVVTGVLCSFRHGDARTRA